MTPLGMLRDVTCHILWRHNCFSNSIQFELIYFISIWTSPSLLKISKFLCIRKRNELFDHPSYWQDVVNEIVKWHLCLVEVLPRYKFWKKWNCPYLLTLLVYFDKILHIHNYWHDLDRDIAKWHLTSVEAVPTSKFWKSENGKTEWTIVMKPCILIDIDKM